MRLPERYSFNHDPKVLQQHRTDYPAPFEKLFYRDDKVTRYISDEPGFCLGEYVNQLIGSKGQSIVYFQDITGEADSSPHWFGAYLVEGTVVELAGEKDDVLAFFDYYLSITDQVIADKALVSVIEDTARGEDIAYQIEGINYHDKVMPRPAVDIEDIPPEYLLDNVSEKKKQRPKTGYFLVAGAAALLAVIVAWSWPSPPPPQPRQVDPYAAWRATDGNNLRADEAFETAAVLAATLNTLPSGWRGVDLSLTASGLQVQILPAALNTRLDTLQGWKDSHPEIAPFLEGNTLTVPVASVSASSLTRLRHLPDTLNNQLIAFGADSVIRSEAVSLGPVQQYEYTVSFGDRPLGILSLLGALLDDYPISINALTVSLTDTMTVKVDTVLLLEGVN